MTKQKTHSILCNPVMFSAVMKDEALFREFLSRILPDRKIKELRLRDLGDEEALYKTKAFLQTEQTIVINPYAKSVRFDVLFEEENIWYDVECQATDTGFLPQRSRYYHAAAAVDSLSRGQEYKELKPGYVIFICLFDLFGQDAPVYSFEMYDRKNSLLLGDGQFTMFLNTTCRKADIPERLKNLFQYLEEEAVDETDPWIVHLHNAVKSMEQEEEVRSRMTLYDEWMRTEIAFEKSKKALAEQKKELESSRKTLAENEKELESSRKTLAENERVLAETAKKNRDLEAASKKAESDRQQFERLIKLLLDQGRTEDMKKALEETAYREKLMAELAL